MSKDASHFDHCNLTNFKTYLNSEIYPYDNLNINFDNKQFAVLYEMYSRVQQYYYYKTIGQPCLSLDKFIETAPLVVIDCCHQIDTPKSGTGYTFGV